MFDRVETVPGILPMTTSSDEKLNPAAFDETVNFRVVPCLKHLIPRLGSQSASVLNLL